MTRRTGRAALQLVTVALFAAPALLISSGCSPECVDKFDCRSIQSRPENLEAKKLFTCAASKCVECPKAGCPGAVVEEEDAGMGGGAGGGAGGGTGGGSDGGTGGGTGGGAAVVDAGPDLSGAFVAKMTANQEVLPTTSTASGSVDVIVTKQSDGGYLATMSGLVLNFGAEVPSAVHIHNKHAGVSGPFLGGSAGNYTVLNTSGVATVSGATPFTAAQVAEIVAGRAYVNIHTDLFPAGAVRGQLLTAGQVLWSAQLSGAASIPPASVDAGLAGVGFIVSDDGGVAYEGSWPASVDAISAHVHLGNATTNGAIVAPLALVGTTGVKGTLSTQQLDAGPDQYVNVHASDAGAGLIRGQIVKH